MLPLTLGSAPVMGDPAYPDSINPGAFLCLCPIPLPPFVRIGLSIGYWEPAMLLDVVRDPYCFVSLGGMEISSPIEAPEAAYDVQETHGNTGGFYQAHLLKNFWAEWLISEIDDLSYEISIIPDYITELDPMWRDDELTNILNPESILFTNVAAHAACAADCVAATAGLPLAPFFWCQGCNGFSYPMNGNVANHIGGVQSATLTAERLIFKMSRVGALWQSHAHTPLDYCFQHIDPILDKTQYRTQLNYPIPQTEAGSVGSCCQPFGRTTALWGSGREFPYKGEDFAFTIWRKRHVCIE